MPKNLHKEAIRALELLNLHELQQIDGNSGNLRVLKGIENEVLARRQEVSVQQPIASSFHPVALLNKTSVP